MTNDRFKFRAKRLDNSEFVCGYYLPMLSGYKHNFKSYFKLGEEGRKEILKGSDSTKLKKTMKKCIFKRIKQCTEEIEEKIVIDKIYGFQLMSYLFDKVDEYFGEYNDKQKETLTNRIYDSLNRGEIGHFHF